MTLPAITGRPLAGDDAEAAATPLSQGAAVDTPKEQRFKLPDGYTMVWTNAGEVPPRAPVNFQFETLSLTYVRDPFETQARQRTLDRLALGVEDLRLEHDVDYDACHWHSRWCLR